MSKNGSSSEKIFTYLKSGNNNDNPAYVYLNEMLDSKEGRRNIPKPIVKRLLGRDPMAYLDINDDMLEALVKEHRSELLVNMLMFMAGTFILQSVSPTYFIRGLVWEKIAGFYNPTANLKRYYDNPGLLAECFTGPRFLIPYIKEQFEYDKALRCSCIEYLQRNEKEILRTAAPTHMAAIRRIQNHLLVKSEISHNDYTVCNGVRYSEVSSGDDRKKYRLILAVAVDQMIEQLSDELEDEQGVWAALYGMFVENRAQITIDSCQGGYIVRINDKEFITGPADSYKFEDYICRINADSIYQQKFIITH